MVTTASDPLITNETLRGSSSSKGVVLQWGAIADLRVKSQKLFRYQPGSKAVSLVTLPINQLSYTDVSAKSGELYRYFLVSVDANGKEGIPGNEIAVRAQ